MKIGFASLYPSRPHLKHMAYLVSQAKRQGHEVTFLELGSGFKHCQPKLGENWKTKSLVSLKHKYAGLSGFLSSDKDILSDLVRKKVKSSPVKFRYSAMSTVASKYGVSSKAQLDSELMVKLIEKNTETISEAYEGSLEWINKRDFDLVIGFNGRIDVTNALMQACLDSDVPYFSLERSWTGIGVQMVKNGTPLSLSGINNVVGAWASKPLKSHQIAKAFSFVVNRFSREAFGEYQQWCSDQKMGLVEQSYGWLYTPSSIFERIGHPDWAVGWESDMEAVEFLLRTKSVDPSKLVVRGHPQWHIHAPNSDQIYSEWCAKLGAKYIESNSNISTQELIFNSENMISYGSTSAFEAAIFGKNVFNLSPTFYQDGGFTINLFSKEICADQLLPTLPQKEVIRLCLRTLYSINYRHMKLTDEIKAINNYDYVFKAIENNDFFLELIENNSFVSDSDACADLFDEDEFLNELLEDIRRRVFDKSFLENYKIRHGIFESDYKSNPNYKDMRRIGLSKLIDLVDKYVR
jgi:hypothetical protein